MLDGYLTRILRDILNKFWKQHPRKNKATYLPSLKPSKSDKQDMRDTTGEVRTNSQATFSNGSLQTDEQALDGQIEHIYNCSVQKQDVVGRTFRKRSPIEANGEKESEKFPLSARYNDIDDCAFFAWVMQKVYKKEKKKLN